MAEETLVKETLSKEMIEEGVRLTEALTKELRLVAALWMFYPENNSWKYHFAAHEGKLLGPHELYRRVQKILAEPSYNYIRLRDVSIRDPDHALLRALGKIIKTGNNLQRIRFVRNAIDGLYIEDAFVYMLNLA